jgi:hypothetical protein
MLLIVATSWLFSSLSKRIDNAEILGVFDILSPKIQAKFSSWAILFIFIFKKEKFSAPNFCEVPKPIPSQITPKTLSFFQSFFSPKIGKMRFVMLDFFF